MDGAKHTTDTLEALDNIMSPETRKSFGHRSFVEISVFSFLIIIIAEGNKSSPWFFILYSRN